MTDKASGEFLRGLAASRGHITSCFAAGSNLPDYRYTTMFFMIKFTFQKDLDKFHSLGFETDEPEKVSV